MLYRTLVLFLLSCSWSYAAPVNINQADADTIAESLSGIGPNKAAAIVKYREANGPFKSVDELKFVKGIGEKIIDQNRNDVIITVDNN